MLWNLENQDFEIMTQPYFAQVPLRPWGTGQNFSEGLCVVGYYAAGEYRSGRGSWHDGWVHSDEDAFFGYLNKYGDLELAPRFKVARNFSEGFAYVEGLDSKVNWHYTSLGYYIDHFGNERFENVGASGNDFSCGHAFVGGGNSGRFIDSKGNFTSENIKVGTMTDYSLRFPNGILLNDILDPHYKLSHGLMPSPGAGSKFGFVNHAGEFKIPAIFDFAFPMSDGIARVMHGEEVAFINMEGERIGDCTYMAAGDFSEGLASVQFFDGTGTAYDGVIDSNGDLVFKREIQNMEQRVGGNLIGQYSCGYAVFASETESGYFDTSGNLFLSNKYSGIQNFKEGFAWVQKLGDHAWDRGLALIDLNGDERFYLTDAYMAQDFSEGISAVKSGRGPWGFIRNRSTVS